MSIEFHSNPFLDILIYSGRELSFKSSSPSVKTVGEKALSELQASYLKYKKEISQLKYGQFLKLVEGSLQDFKQGEVPLDVKETVSSRLRALGNQQIEKEKSFSKVHRFFHKFSQFLRGRSFCTEGEFGLKLARKVQIEEKGNCFAKLKALILGARSYLDQEQAAKALKGMEREINELPPSEFKRLLEKVFFANREAVFIEKMKFAFYKGLSEDKKNLFDEILSDRREDWFDQAFDIVSGIDPKNYKEIISKPLLRSFAMRRIALRSALKGEKEGAKVQFFTFLIEALIKRYLEGDQRSDYQDIRALLNQEQISIAKLEKNPLLLSEEDFKKLKKHIAEAKVSG